MSREEDLYRSLIASLRRDVPGFEIRYKNRSWKQKLLGLLSRPFNSGYMTRFTTTSRPYVYFPNKELEESNFWYSFLVLSHESVHLWDQQSKLFYLYYALPQLPILLALMAFFGFLNSWFLLFLGFLIFAYPFPSSGRSELEIRGYGTELAIEYWLTGKIKEDTINNLVRVFTGWSYYRMCSNEKMAEGLVRRCVEEIKTGSILEGTDGHPFRVIRNLLKEKGMLVV